MKYFNNLPTIRVIDSKGHSKSYKNIMTRLSIIPSILENPLLYYSYDLKESDTPEIVADKYYGDSYRYWIVLFSNQILDPQWDWPLSSSILDEYIQNKYTGTGIDVYNDVKSYRKIITQYNPATGQTNTSKVEISEEEYTALLPYEKSLSFTTGTLIVSVNKEIVNYYDYEIEKNEAKRSIKLLNKDYVSQLESEFKKLVA
jgi:sulfur carrier protein ThiS